MSDKFITGWNGVKVSVDDAKKYWNPNPVGFSPEKNKQIIAQTIAKAEKMHREFLASKENDLRERTSALADYINFISTHDEKVNTPEKYFGRKTLARLRGQHILHTLHRTMTGQTAIRTIYSDKIIE